MDKKKIIIFFVIFILSICQSAMANNCLRCVGSHEITYNSAVLNPFIDNHFFTQLDIGKISLRGTILSKSEQQIIKKYLNRLIGGEKKIGLARQHYEYSQKIWQDKLSLQLKFESTITNSENLDGFIVTGSGRHYAFLSGLTYKILDTKESLFSTIFDFIYHNQWNIRGILLVKDIVKKTSKVMYSDHLFEFRLGLSYVLSFTKEFALQTDLAYLPQILLSFDTEEKAQTEYKDTFFLALSSSIDLQTLLDVPLGLTIAAQIRNITLYKRNLNTSILLINAGLEYKTPKNVRTGLTLSYSIDPVAVKNPPFDDHTLEGSFFFIYYW